MSYQSQVKKRLSVLIAACCIVVGWSPTPTFAVPVVLQTANNVVGNQAYSGVGVRFDVNTTIFVTDLGIFDSGQDGIAAPATAPLSTYLMTDAGVTQAFTTFDSTDRGTLDAASKYRFKPISTLTLVPGTYILVGYGWNNTDLEHNCFFSGACETFNDGGGLVTYVDSPFGVGGDAPGTKPIDTSDPTNFFSGPNMRYDDQNNVPGVPEPSTFILLGSGLTGLAAWRRKRKA